MIYSNSSGTFQTFAELASRRSSFITQIVECNLTTCFGNKYWSFSWSRCHFGKVVPPFLSLVPCDLLEALSPCPKLIYALPIRVTFKTLLGVPQQFLIYGSQCSCTEIKEIFTFYGPWIENLHAIVSLKRRSQVVFYISHFNII